MADFSGKVSILLPVHGSGNMAEETRVLDPLHGVILNTSGDLYIQFGEEESI